MSDTNLGQIQNRIFVFLYGLFAAMPVIGFALFNLGIGTNYQQITSLFLMSFLSLSIYSAFSQHKGFEAAIFSIPLLIYSVVVFVYSYNTVVVKNKTDEVFGMIMLNFGPHFLGLLFYNFRHLISELTVLKLIFYTGLFISIVNIILFILLIIGQYSAVSNYMILLGNENYIESLDVFLRPSGYFFDIHSQYYLPLFALAIQKYIGIVKGKKSEFLVYTLILLALIIGGVKSGYLTLLVLLGYWFFNSITNVRSYVILALFGIVVLIGDVFTGNTIISLWNRIWSHDIEILIEHLTFVPIHLYQDYPSVFIFGGQPRMQSFIYSEVYFVQLISFIGIVGWALFYAYPIIFLLTKRSNPFVKSITIIFALSLLHYAVFRVGVNLFGSALIFYFFYKIQLNRQAQVE